jgi:hypothetical protein
MTTVIDIDKQVLFVHIPKCAGTFIEKNLTPEIDWHSKGEKHFSLQQCVDSYGEDIVNKCFRFTVIRNPFNRLVSFYLYHQRKNTQLFSVNFIEANFRAFKKDYYQSFSNFVFNLKHYHHNLERWAKNDIMPCHEFLITHQGIGVDVILKQETLSDDLSLLHKKTGMSFNDERINASPNSYNIKEYYDQKEINFVLNFYKADFYHYYPGAVVSILTK